MTANQASSDLEQAKANVAQAAREVDLLEPLRKHPFLTVVIAGVGGAVLGSSENTLGAAARLTTGLTAMVRVIHTALGSLRGEDRQERRQETNIPTGT